MAFPSTAQRSQSLDVVRGAALLGVFAANVEFFSRPLREVSSGMATGLAGTDYATALLLHAFVHGKFWLLFALLFGAGFALLERRTGVSFLAVHYRRTIALGVIGALHSIFIWAGDILLTYALVALVLPAFRHTPAPQLLRWCTVLFGVPVLVMLLGSLAAFEDGVLVSKGAIVYAPATPNSYTEATALRFTDTIATLQSLPVFGVMVLGAFLAGAWFIRSSVLVNHREHARLWRALLWLLPIGVLLAAVSMSISLQFGDTPKGMLAASVMLAASPCLALGYLACIVVILQRGRRGAHWLSLLAPVGRMALTNYLLQSVLAALVFYDYALGVRLNRFAQIALVLALFAAQVIVSRWWFAAGRKHGPLEWLWRTCTYWKLPSRSTFTILLAPRCEPQHSHEHT